VKSVDTQLITERLYEIKSFVSVYRKYAESAQDESKVESTKREMKIVKEQILKQLIDLKKHVKRLEGRVTPRIGGE